ncbi:leucine-rich repeat domain-containing protein [Cellulomonas sp. Leaf334]|uniref:leucine-rich repeat domain-containing protein n=1 Tax=Cellulomonas sp. Leaf334 TaxID=1736339 RepID=UPI0006FB6571|nr:leucine-rich repeat domain-containing protein [Cellulomonas sp. Leaf334]KQR08618.1 hypothetical protein ASF78_20500 [Cellulomonas sp. Leaf334]
MATMTRAEVVRRVGAGVVALVAVGVAATSMGDGTWALLGDGFRALLGEGSTSTAGDALRMMLADGWTALTLALGLVPAAALVLVAASRSDHPSPRTTRLVVGLVATGVVLLVVGVAALSTDPTSVRLAARSWYFTVGSPRMLAGLWLAFLAAGAVAAGTGVLLRRRGAVVVGAVLAAVGALATLLSAGAGMALTVWSLGRYRGGATSVTVVLRDGSLAFGFVAAVATVVAGWGAVAAWRRLAHWAAPRAAERSEAQARRRRLVARGTVGALVLALAIAVGARVAARELVPDVVADPVLATCVERALGVGQGRGLAPDRFDEVYVIECPWDGDGDQVTSLAGIERLTSVHEIDLSGQDVADVGPLAALTDLRSLRLTGNARLDDLSALTGLPLENLGLSSTGVSDLEPLTRTPSLLWVGLAWTRVSDLGPLAASAGLIELDLREAAVTDLSPLAGAASLSKLDVRDNRVADVTPLASLPALDELWIGGNPVTDLRPLLDAPALLGVDVEGLDPLTPGIDELRAQGVYVNGYA